MTTSTPGDLAAFRTAVEHVTGIADPNALGIAGDRAHQLTGGYHLGKSDLQAIGHYHPPATAHVGSTAEDYSARQQRDRQGLTEDASAVDVDQAWPNGGRAAWLRWNNLVVRDLRAGIPSLAAIRGINTTLDGVTPRRFDALTGWAPEPTSDRGHTHTEFWRDTAGARGPALAHLLDLMTEAITGSVVDVRTPDDVFNLIAGLVNGDTAPMGVPSQIPNWVHAIQGAAKASDVAPLVTAVNNLTAEIVALQQNPTVMPTAAGVAGEIIKQLGITPR
jgi:hypothetical protein